MLREAKDTSSYFDRLWQKYQTEGVVSAIKFEAVSSLRTIPGYISGFLDHIWTYFKIGASPCGPEDTENWHFLNV